MTRGRTIWFALGALLAIGAPVGLVVQKERVIAEGRPVLLALAPVDPRSLIQGDYMVLRYVVEREAEWSDWPRDGRIVLRLDSDGVGTLARRDDGSSLAQGEWPLRYRIRGGDLRLGAEAFFFQEGYASYFGRARYGELRVTPKGDSVLVGLRDDARAPLDHLIEVDP